MLDTQMRARLEAPLDRAAGVIERIGIGPNAVTAIGLAIGIAGCVAIALGQWWLGLVLWCLNRVADGLDGPLARRKGATELGGYFDILADFMIYGGVLIGIAIDMPDARLVCLVTLFTYYLSGSSFLAFSSLAMKRRLDGDGRSLFFPAGLAEGTETILAYILVLSLRDYAVTILWIWAAIVAITLVQRAFAIALLLRS